MKVAVGSENPVKINAVKRAFKLVWDQEKLQVNGLKVSSGVSEQPMSDKESIKGATLRAKRAIKIAKADYGIGLEGGLQKIGKLWFDCGWCVVVDKNGTVGIGSSARIQTPEKIMELIRKGKELGEANDILFNTKYSKRRQGHFGLMTKGVVTRTDAYKDSIVLALSRFVHPELF
jgi:inosine/xanthosine triphosphatase